MILTQRNLRDLYPDLYKRDHFIEANEEVLKFIQTYRQALAAYERRLHR